MLAHHYVFVGDVAGNEGEVSVELVAVVLHVFLRSAVSVRSATTALVGGSRPDHFLFEKAHCSPHSRTVGAVETDQFVVERVLKFRSLELAGLFARPAESRFSPVGTGPYVATFQTAYQSHGFLLVRY